MTDMQAQIKISVLDAFSPGLKKLGLELRDVGGELTRTGDKGKRAGAELATGLNQAAEAMGRIRDFTRGLLTEPIEQFASLDAALAKVSAKTGEARGTAGFEALANQAEALGAATKYSAEQVAGAQAEFAAAGRNTQEVLAALPNTLSFATAGTLELARASEITNEVLNQFNLSASETVRVQDVLARADEVSAASIEGLGEALSYSGATAARLNIPLETTAALLAQLANAGQKGSTGGTELAAFLSSIVAPSKMARAALHDMGLSLAQIKELQTQVATGDIETAIRRMAELNAQLDPRKSAEVLDKVFGERGGRAASVLFRAALDPSDKGLSAMVGEFQKAEGAVARTAAIMESSFAASLERAKGAVDAATTAVGKAFAPVVAKAAGWLERAAGALQEFAETHPEAMETLGTALLAVAALTTIVAPILTFGAAIAGMAAIWGPLTAGLGATVAVLSGPVGLVVALAALGTAIYAFRKELGLVSDDAERGKDKGQRSYRDGTVLDAQGRVVRENGKLLLGSGEGAPAIVREARARGFTDPEDIAAFVANRVERTPVMLRGTGYVPAPTGRELLPGRRRGQGPLLPDSGAPLAGSALPSADDLEMAVREQTAVSRQSSSEQLDLSRQMVGELRRLNRPTYRPVAALPR